MFAALEPGQDAEQLVGVIGRNDDGDRSADGLRGRVAVQPLGAGVPARDDALERAAHDGVVGEFHDGRQVRQRRLVSLPFRHDRGDQDAHHRHRAEERLQEQQRLVRRAVGERTQAADGSPDRQP